MNLKTVSKDELITRTQRLVVEERRITAEVLWHLLEIERRRLFSELGFSSLFEYCVKELKYSESAAYRRISAMRLLRDVPDVAIRIETGEISVTNAAALQSAFVTAKRQEKRSFSSEEKKDLVDKLCGTSSRQCQKLLASICPQALTPDQSRMVSETKTEITFVADEELVQMLTRIKELSAHKLHGATDYNSVFKLMALMMLQKLEPVKKEKTAAHEEAPKKASEKEMASENASGLQDIYPKQCQSALPAAEVRNDTSSGEDGDSVSCSSLTSTSPNSRYIPAPVKRAVWQRDTGQCTFVDPHTGRRCESRYGLEIDHIVPFALGGSNALPNLRLVCRAHNQLYAVRVFGEKKMAAHFNDRH